MNVYFYNSSNTLLSSYTGLTSVSSSGTTFYLFDVPANTFYVKYQYDYSGQTYQTVKYVQGTNQNQYYYLNDNIVDTIYCVGKKEARTNITKDILQAGKKNNVVQFKYTEEITQNTGFHLREDQYLDLNNTPYIYTFSGLSVKEYILNEQQFQGYNTRTFANRNDVITMNKTTTYRRYTSEQNNFFR